MSISTLRYEIDEHFYDTEGVCDLVAVLIREVHPEGVLILDLNYVTNPQTGELAVTVDVTRQDGKCRHRMHYHASLITPLESQMEGHMKPANAPDQDVVNPGGQGTTPVAHPDDLQKKRPLTAPDTGHLSDYSEHVEEAGDDDDDLTEFMDDDEEDDTAVED